MIGQRASTADFDRVVTADELVRAPDGRVVAQFIKHAIAPPTGACEAWLGIEKIERPSLTRRAAAGAPDLAAFQDRFPNAVEMVPETATTVRLRMRDGRLLAQPMSNPVLSFLAGYGVDRFTNTARPCRLTHRYPQRWADSLPLFMSVDAALRRAMPDVHARMLERAASHPRWAIEGTALSTVTINVNYESRYHLDVGDFKDGYSALTVVEDGEYTGGLYVIPEHRIAFDVREGDVLLCQSHVDVHGNTAIAGPGRRYSFVCYLKHALATAVNA